MLVAAELSLEYDTVINRLNNVLAGVGTIHPCGTVKLVDINELA